MKPDGLDANRATGYSDHAPGKGVVDKSVFRGEALVAKLGDIENLVLILQGTEDA